MAGRPKQGIDYAGWSTSMFDSDEKIDLLLDVHGWTGFGVYFYLCQRAFSGDGYFYKWGCSSSASTARKMGGGIGSNTVKEVVGHCLRTGLFNQALYDRWGILTSRGIQRSFWRVLSARRSKIVYREYWLLDDSECPGLVKVTLNQNQMPANEHVQATNEHAQPANAYKNRTVQNSTVKRDTPAAVSGQRPVSSDKLISLYRKEIGEPPKGLDAVVTAYGEQRVMEAIRVASDNGHRTLGYVKGILRNWEAEGTGPGTRKKNAFLNYGQREIDYDALERELADLSYKELED